MTHIHHVAGTMKRRIKFLYAAKKSAAFSGSKSTNLALRGEPLKLEGSWIFSHGLSTVTTHSAPLLRTPELFERVLRCYSSKVITNFIPALEASARILADSRCARAWINLASASCWASRKWQNKDQWKATGILVQNLCD